MPSPSARNILVAVDGSVYSERAFSYLVEVLCSVTETEFCKKRHTGTVTDVKEGFSIKCLITTGYAAKFRQERDQVVFVHVYESPITPPPTFANSMSVPPREEWERMLQKAERQAVEILSNYEKKCREIELPFKTIYAYGPIGHVICTVAKEEKAECIILGSRGLGTIRRTILGSVCDYVTQHMTVPVLMVPPTDNR